MTRDTRRLSLLLPIALLVATSGCPKGGEHDNPGGLVQYDAGPGGAPDGSIRPNRPVLAGEIAPVYGFVAPETRVEYYYLGEVDRAGPTVPVNPIYFFYDESDTPLFALSEDGSRLVGWHPVINVVPTQHGYSPYWRVHKVKVKGKLDPKALAALMRQVPIGQRCQMDAVCPGDQRCIEQRCSAPIGVGDFGLDGIKSLDTLKQSELAFSATSTVINCPVVDADAKLLKGLSNPDLPFPKVQLWFRRQKAFCYLVEGGKELLQSGAPAVAMGKDDNEPPIADAFFFRQTLSFGGSKPVVVLPARNLVLTAVLPGAAGYSSLVREWTVEVDSKHEFDDVRSVQEARDKGLKITETKRLHNLAVRGTIPACKTDQDCAGTGGKVDPPLKCSVEQGYCSPPFARFGEECRRGVKECDPKGGPDGTALACVGLRVRDKYFCFNACDSSTADGNPDPEIDTRCGSSPTTRCFALRQTDPARPNGVCIKQCNSRAGDQAALIAQCVSPTCGNGKLDFGETCDDGNDKDGDGCNRFCSLSTFERCESQSDCRGAGQTCEAPVVGQSNSYCLPATAEKDEREEDDKFRNVCMEFDYCWPPDERADWLGKTDEEVQP